MDLKVQGFQVGLKVKIEAANEACISAVHFRKSELIKQAKGNCKAERHTTLSDETDNGNDTQNKQSVSRRHVKLIPQSMLSKASIGTSYEN